MEQTESPPPVTVEGDWGPAQTKTVKNKLELYFGSKKKSSGGDCRVEAEGEAPRAAVYFQCQEVRERVIARKNHEIIVGNQTFKLRLISAPSPVNSDDASDLPADLKTPEATAEKQEDEETDTEKEKSVQSGAVVLDNMSDRLSRDLLSMLVENISGLDESCYSLEIIWESSRAVITFNKPADVEKFLTGSQCSQKLQKHGLTARPLEAAESVRVENLPLTVIKEMLELFFERSWTLPDNVVMIPDEHAAIATFNDAKVVESICHERDYAMLSITFKVYPYYESMGTALYGKERPTWKMPEPFTESVHNVFWRFLRDKKLFQSINDQMSSYFCSVNLDNAEIILSPLPSLLRQKGLTAKHVDTWMSTAQEAFRQQMSQYSAFECKVNASAWKAAEEEVRSIVKEDAALVHDASRGILTVAGRGDDIKKVKGPVENIVLTASLDEGAQKLTITGLPAEVYKTKSWILEPTVGTSKKQLNVPPSKSQSINDVNAFSSRVQETIHFRSFAVVQFIENKKKQEWFSIAKDNAVEVQFDSESTKITLTGDRLHVQKAKFCFHQLTSALSSHNFVVEKPGAKKYFLTQGSLFLSEIMTECSCVVVLCPISQSQQYSASFGQVSSTSLSVYQMQMGQLTLEVSPGDITKEACDVIINSSNKDFSLRSGVSKAILDSAGITVEQECSRIVSSPTFQSDTFIHTSAGLLPSKNIIHIVGQKDPANIKEVVYSVLQYCEDNKLKSVAFPALGTGQGRVSPSDVADAMVDAVVDFVRKKQTRFVHSVKILIFQPVMMSLFHKSMRKREGQEVKEKSTLTTLKANATSYFMGLLEQRASADHLVLESEEFEPAVFQLCADNDMAVKKAKKRIEELIVAEQAQNTITGQYISQLSQEDMDQLKALQRKLTVSIRLERGHEDQEPYIRLEGLTRDVYTAESAIRDIIRKVERSENRKSKALMIKEHVEWQFDFRGTVVPLDDDTNFILEEAREKKQPGVMIKINNEKYHADVMKLNAVSVRGHKQLELLRKYWKADDAALPSHWDDMEGDLIKLFPVAAGSREYTDVETELRTSLAPNIIYQRRLGSGFTQRGKRDGWPAGWRSGVVADVALSGWAQPGSVASLSTRRSLTSPPWPGSRRRPQTFLPVLDADDAALPSHWDAGSEEYTDVETELRNNGLTPNIISIERVQNTTLWKSYQLLKKQLEVKNKHNNNERKLFHETRAENIDLINKRGFHRSYAGTHGAMYGNGSYFAVSATYSQSQAKPYTRPHKCMYLAKVLVGDFTTGRAGMITPPTKSSSNATGLYDSVADNSANPTIFVVFNDIQAYPEYLITFI